MPTDTIDEPAVTTLSPEQIAKDRAAASRIPDSPMDAAVDDIISHPSASFNDMASKLDKAMKEVTVKEKSAQDKSAAPTDKEQTDSRHKKPEAKAEPAKAETEAKIEVTEDIENKTITSAKAADWKALKEKLKSRETEVAEFKQKWEFTTKEYDEFKKKAVDTSQLEPVVKERDTIKAERDKLQEQLEAVALERSEKFSSHFQKKFDDATARAKEASGTHAERIEQLMALPPSKWRKDHINEIREQLDGVDQGQLDISIAEFDRARSERETELKNSKANYQKLVELESSRQQAERQQAEQRTEAAMRGVLAVARDKYDAFKKTDDEEHNAVVARNEAFVENFFKRNLDVADVALLPVIAKEGERLQLSVVPALQKKIAELEAAVKEYQSANPKPGGGSPRPATDSKGKGFIETFQEQWPAGNR